MEYQKKTFDGYRPGEPGFGQKWRFWPEIARNSFFTLVDMIWPVLTRWTRFWSEMTVLTRNSFFALVDMVWPVLTQWTRFLLEMTVLTRNSSKLIFYPGPHGLTRITPVNLVLVGNDGFDPKQPANHFLPWSTWFDSYYPGELGCGRKWRFWPETARKSFFTLVDMVWPGGLGFDGKMRLTREKYFLNFKLFS